MSATEEQGHVRRFLRTVGQTFRFSGRATRTDVVVFYFGIVALGLVIDLLTWPLPDNLGHRVELASEWLLLAPFPALFVRRAHDHGRSGWWVLAPLFVAAKSAGLSLLAQSEGLAARVALESHLFVLDGLAVLLALAALAIVAAPGDAGPNRFGPDPRDQD